MVACKVKDAVRLDIITHVTAILLILTFMEAPQWGTWSIYMTGPHWKGEIVKTGLLIGSEQWHLFHTSVRAWYRFEGLFEVKKIDICWLLRLKKHFYEKGTVDLHEDTIKVYSHSKLWFIRKETTLCPWGVIKWKHKNRETFCITCRDNCLKGMH